MRFLIALCVAAMPATFALAQEPLPAPPAPKPETRSFGIKPAEISRRMLTAIQVCWMPQDDSEAGLTRLKVMLDATGALIGTPEILTESTLTPSALRAVERCAPYSFVREIARSAEETLSIEVVFQP